MLIFTSYYKLKTNKNMKKLILICLLAIITLSSRQTLKAQITLEHTYDTASLLDGGLGGGLNQLYMVTLEVEGMKYIKINYSGYKIEMYNLDHSIFKIMDLSPFIAPYNIDINLLFVSEHLFNTDDQIEYMICYEDSVGNFTWHTKIINESGNIIFSEDHQAPVDVIDIPQKQFPIYNTPNGTKMILTSDSSYKAFVYSLPGTLTTSIQPINNTLGNQMLENIYPNPSNGNTTIEFNLPQGVTTGELLIYSMQGVELKRYRVDNTFHTLLLNNSEFHAGTYFYQLITSTGASGAKKMVVIH